MNESVILPPPDAFNLPQSKRPGCQHQLGCKCTPPYYLRPSSPAEVAREVWYRNGLKYTEGKITPEV